MLLRLSLLLFCVLLSPLAAQGSKPTTGSPNDECCDGRRDIGGPYSGHGGQPAGYPGGPITPGGNSVGDEASGPITGGITVSPDGNVALSVLDVRRNHGLQGAAGFYLRGARYANDPDIYAEIAAQHEGYIPNPGWSVVAVAPTDMCDPANAIKFPCNYQTVSVLTMVGWEDRNVCICEPVQVGGGGGGSGAVSVPFEYLGQRRSMPTRPLVFQSPYTGATLWYHSFWSQSEHYIEIKHLDGTVARFSTKQAFGVGGVNTWRLEKLWDPYDNMAEWVYDVASGHFLQYIRFPNGLAEKWDWLGSPAGWVNGYSAVQVTYHDATVDPWHYLGDALSWGMVFENQGARTHF